MKLHITKLTSGRRSAAVEEFLTRPTFDPKAEAIASELLADIRTRGEIAVLAAISKIEKLSLSPAELRVSARELAAAEKAVDPATKARIEEAHERVADFARRSMRPDWSHKTDCGGTLGEFFTPLDRVGVYVPGGTAPLASTVIMTATLAQVAGVREIVACTPGGRDKAIRPEVLYAMKVAGVTEIYRVGGIQAIGLMAYGTRKVSPVQKIVGPGNAYVTAAKRQVYGTVALDLVAGPSEIAVLADSSANPAWVAADILSQAEHGSGHERSLFVTDDAAFAEKVKAEVIRQTKTLSRHEMVERVVANGGILLAVAPSLEDGMALVNRFAPEHFELQVADPARFIPMAVHCGAVFAGYWTPESAGDFAAGPSHVLPTGGAARMFNGLTVEDFRHRTSLVGYTEGDLKAALPVISRFADIEGLDGHRNAATIRFPQPPRA